MREWLDWLTRVRLLLITLILAVGVVWPQYGPEPEARAAIFLPLIVFWITLGTIHIILLRWLPNARWHGRAAGGLRRSDGLGAGVRRPDCTKATSSRCICW